jgi:hypothetical protein
MKSYLILRVLLLSLVLFAVPVLVTDVTQIKDAVYKFFLTATQFKHADQCFTDAPNLRVA